MWGTAFIVEWHAPALFEPAVNCDGVTAYLLGPKAICDMNVLLCDLVKKKRYATNSNTHGELNARLTLCTCPFFKGA